jgi:hypothetical protein
MRIDHIVQKKERRGRMVQRRRIKGRCKRGKLKTGIYRCLLEKVVC